MKFKQVIAMLFLGMLGGGLSFLGLSYFQPNPETQSEVSFNQQLPNQAQPQFASLSYSNAQELNEDFIEASHKSTQSVVFIKTTSEHQMGITMFDWLFGGSGGTQMVTSSGSGVIYSKDGHIVTNNHVIKNATEIEVMVGKKPYPAKVIGADPSSDLAVLKIEGKDFPAIELGSSRNLEVGEWVLAVGNPFNLNSTVTAGIVSAKGRDLGIVKNQFPLESFIQTDAAINPGNSGGALVNLRGQLVGINTAIFSKTGSYTGYGFAVPVDMMKKIVDDLINYGKVQKVFLGAEIQELDFNAAKNLETENLEGVVVGTVLNNWAFDKADIESGDIIRKVNGFPVLGESTFDEEISYYDPGDKIQLTIERNGKTLQKQVTLTNEEGTTDVVRRHLVTSENLGADFETISKVEMELYNIENGVRITNIRKGLVRQAGLPDGFVITEINGRRIKTTEDAISLLESLRGRVQVEGIKKNGRLGLYSYYY